MSAFSGIAPVVRALVISFALSLILFVILSFIMLYSSMSEQMIRPMVLVVSLIAMVIVGFVASRGSNIRGFLIGGIAALLYMLILYIIGVLVFSAPPFNLNGLIRFLYAFVAGAVGGVLGKNIFAKKNR